MYYVLLLCMIIIIGRELEANGQKVKIETALTDQEVMSLGDALVCP